MLSAGLPLAKTARASTFPVAAIVCVPPSPNLTPLPAYITPATARSALGVVVPIPTFPSLSMMNAVFTMFEVVVVDTRNKGERELPDPDTESRDPGLDVPTPALPRGSMIKVVLATLDDPIMKGTAPLKEFMANMAPGVDVAIPTLGNPPDDPMLRMGGDTVVVVAKEKALKMFERMVEVDEEA